MSVDYRKLSPQEAIEKKQECVRKALSMKETSLKIDGQLLTEEREQILSLSVNELLSKLKDGSLKAIDTLKAFQAKALIEHKKTNCITEFVPAAEEWAKERDSTPLKERGMLHGLPISIKENFDIEGMDTTLGLTKRLGKPSKTNSVLVLVLLRQGAVPFVKTNVPQLIYSVGCSNPIYGCTTNPFDSTRSCGGSSGGEAALIKGGGSLLGIGTDMMGSVRIPATFCGVYSLKPTQRRMSREGCYGTFKNMIGVANTSGFLGRDVDSIVIGLKALLADNYMCTLDPKIPYLEWRNHLYDVKRTLTIGWYEEIELFPGTPGVKRAIRLAKQSLQEKGHKLVPFQVPQMDNLYDCGMNILLSEGGGAMLKHWEGGEIVDDAVKFNKKVLSAPSWIKRIFGLYMSYYSPILAKMASHDAASSDKLWEAVGIQKELTDNIFKVWKEKDLDVLLGPAFPSPAPHPEHHGTLMPACMYFGSFNLYDFPCGTLPVTSETKDDQELLEDYPTTDYIYQTIKKTTKGAEGLPLCVQIAGLPWQEETVLYAMKELQQALERK